MEKLDGKVAIVTGAARGLGRAYAKRLAGLGAKIAVADLNLHSYEEFEAEAKDMTADSTVAEIEASGGTAFGIEVDVRDHEAVEAMVGRVVQEWGRVDVLVANAGGGRGRPVDTKTSTLDPPLLHLVTEMNLFGTVYSCNAVAPIMKQQRSGKLGRWDRTFRRWRLRPLRRGQSSNRSLHAVSGAGSRAVRHHGELYRPWRDRHRADHGDGHSQQRSEQPRSGGVGRASAARNRRGLRQDRRVSCDRSVRLCYGRGDPDRWRVSSRVIGDSHSAGSELGASSYTRNIHFAYTASADS
jgi:NAD(P)-dependent dehydrogenase (short-subunit alcohol dehydrogenase family)